MSTVNNNVTKLVTEFQEATKKHRRFLDGLTLTGRRNVWENVAQAALIAQDILNPNNKDDYLAALAERKIVVPKGKSANPYGPVVKLLYGEWKDEQYNVFVENRSSEKYACVFRYFAEHRAIYDMMEKREEQIGVIADHIENYESTHGRNLKGIEKEDRVRHPAAEPSSPKGYDYLDLGLRLDRGEVARLDSKPEFIPEDASYGKLWFRMVEGKVVIMGYEAVQETAYKALATKRGKALKKAHDDAL